MMLLALPGAALAQAENSPDQAFDDVAVPLPTDPTLRAAHERGELELTLVPMEYEVTPGSDDDLSPQGVTPGDCGYAFMWMFKQGKSIYQEWGFFDLSIRATAYSWSYSVVGPSTYSRNRSGGGTLLFRREWTGTDAYAVPRYGWHYGNASLTATNGISTCNGYATDSVRV